MATETIQPFQHQGLPPQYTTSDTVTKQPDIPYHPDREKWYQRTARRLAEDPSLPQTPLPKGFPQQVQSPLLWEGGDWNDESQWVYNLTEEHLKEIEEAVKHFHGMSMSSILN